MRRNDVKQMLITLFSTGCAIHTQNMAMGSYGHQPSLVRRMQHPSLTSHGGISSLQRDSSSVMPLMKYPVNVSFIC